MRQIFREWNWDERTLAVGPLALWIAAFLVWSLVLMVRRRRWRSPAGAARELGVGWKASFVVVVAWLVGCSVWLTVTG